MAEVKTRRYRVMRGAYIEGRHPAPEGARGVPKVYGKGKEDGDIVETEKDLLKHNSATGTPKFILLDEERASASRAESTSPPKASAQPAAQQRPAPAATQDNREYAAKLQSKSIKELQDHAKEEEVELGNAKTKDEIIRVLLANM